MGGGVLKITFMLRSKDWRTKEFAYIRLFSFEAEFKMNSSRNSNSNHF